MMAFLGGFKEVGVKFSGRGDTRVDAAAELARLQSLITMPRETLPRLTAQEAGRYLRGAAERLGLEYSEIAGVAPIFLLLPPGETAPAVTLFQTWHAEALPVEPGAVEGGERLALGVAVAGAAAGAVVAAAGSPEVGAGTGGPEGHGRPVALVVAPSSSSGSRVLAETLRAHRARLAGGAAYWIRVTPPGAESGPRPRRRRVFLGARGRVVIALRGGEGNPYRARDTVVQELRDAAYGPRPLDFELIRKVASRPEALGLAGVGEVAGERAGEGAADGRLRAALFEPRGEIVIPPVPHPDRPRAWLTFETAEAMEADAIASRVQALSGGGRAEVVENFPWDRSSIHHPAIHALIELARETSEGAEIWPCSPWPSPSGLFSRAVGIGLAEWGIPLPLGTKVRFPLPDVFGVMALEVTALLVRAAGAQGSGEGT